MKKFVFVILALVIISIAGYYYLQNPKSGIEKACVNSGGEVRTSLCCKLTDDFPNLCLIGACGCSPQNSKETKICDCGTDRCFDGSKCTALTLPE